MGACGLEIPEPGRLADDETVTFAAELIDRSGRPPVIEAALAHRTGRPRPLPVRAVLTALLCLALDDRPLFLTEATRLLFGQLSGASRALLGVTGTIPTQRAFEAAYRRVRYCFDLLYVPAAELQAPLRVVGELRLASETGAGVCHLQPMAAEREVVRFLFCHCTGILSLLPVLPVGTAPPCSAFGDGLLTTQDAEWQRQKRYLQPLFVARRVNGYATAMTEQVQQVVQRWRARPPGTVDLHEEMTRLTLATVCRILFGEDLGQALPVVQRTFGPLGEAVRRRALAGGRVPQGWPTPVNQRLRRAQRELRSVCDQIVAHRRASGDRQEDLLGLLLDAQDEESSLTDGEVRDQVLVFLLAGHETTSTALTYTLYLLGRHPGVQHRVRAEVDTIAGDRALTAQDVSALGYTTMVLKEAMRLYPSAPFLGRRAVQDDQIGGYHIPAGADVVLAPWITHRHPTFWERPERFDPQRLTPEQEKARHRYAWFPFGGGPRACIGQHFSMLESVIALATLVRDFQFAAPPGEPARTNHITLRPTHGVPSRVMIR